MKNLSLAVAALTSLPTAALAIGPCYQEPGTRAMYCIDGAHVHSNGDLRESKLYTGGPGGVSPTSHTIIADCARRVTVLQDRLGVNFGGGKFDATPMNQELSADLCAAKKTTPDKKLRQF